MGYRYAISCVSNQDGIPANAARKMYSVAKIKGAFDVMSLRKLLSVREKKSQIGSPSTIRIFHTGRACCI